MITRRKDRSADHALIQSFIESRGEDGVITAEVAAYMDWNTKEAATVLNAMHRKHLIAKHKNRPVTYRAWEPTGQSYKLPADLRAKVLQLPGVRQTYNSIKCCPEPGMRSGKTAAETYLYLVWANSGQPQAELIEV